MAKNSVAVLDIRSSELTVAVAERGVNQTFIVKSKSTCAYDGYFEGEMIDKNSFTEGVNQLVSEAVSSVDKRIKSFYVGVPGEFVKTVVTQKTVSFSSPKKITQKDVQTLEEASIPQITEDYEVIRCGCLYYVLSDKRKVIDPVGCTSDSLSGKLCFYIAKSTFLNLVRQAFEPFRTIKTLYFIPTLHAEAMYLMPPAVRDDYSVLLHLGFISSDYLVTCGNGLAFADSFSVGIGHIAVYVMSELDIPYDAALKLLGLVNLNSKEERTATIEFMHEGKTYRFLSSLVRDKIHDGLDGICEMIEACNQSFTERNLQGKKLYITGECVKSIRGTVEHLSNRLEKNVEVIAPPLPYYDKPQFSSLFSLFEIALSDEAEHHTIFSKLGF
jgi:cell division ATPase FtsA